MKVRLGSLLRWLVAKFMKVSPPSKQARWMLQAAPNKQEKPART